MTDSSREALIKELVTELRPVRGAGDTLLPLATWLAAALLYTFAIVLAAGELRDGAGRMLLESRRLVLETAASGAAIVLLARAALVSGIPGARAIAWLAPAGLAVGVWLALHVAGAASGAQSGAMEGKRDHCFWQTVLFGLPSFALLLGYARSLMSFAPRVTAALAGRRPPRFPVR